MVNATSYCNSYMQGFGNIGTKNYMQSFESYRTKDIDNIKGSSLSNRSTVNYTDLNSDERDILETIKSILDKVPNCNLQVLDKEEKLNPDELSIGMVGFTCFNRLPTGDHRDFTITLDILQKMATDEDYKNEILSFISEEAKSAIDDSRPTNPMDLYNSYAQFGKIIPTVHMDFWNVDDDDKKNNFKSNLLEDNISQPIISKYTLNFKYV